jgi:NAD(P)-dependent dehydrogenase (short-subunit alcohol dehydrogenase family)
MKKTLPNALIIGSYGAIGSALVFELKLDHQVHEINRTNCDFTEEALAKHASELAKYGTFSRIVCTIGLLHGDDVYPERSLKQINGNVLQRYFWVNSVVPMLCMKQFAPLLTIDQPAVYLNLSAMVGSIGDNQLGGWYGYRASKAALNMLVKTTAIEVRRRNPNAIIVAIHPGTTRSSMSAPFSKNVKPEKYYPPELSAQRLLQVANNLTPADSGGFFNWDGNRLPW